MFPACNMLTVDLTSLLILSVHISKMKIVDCWWHCINLVVGWRATGDISVNDDYANIGKLNVIFLYSSVDHWSTSKSAVSYSKTRNLSPMQSNEHNGKNPQHRWTNLSVSCDLLLFTRVFVWVCVLLMCCKRKDDWTCSSWYFSLQLKVNCK